MRRRTLIWLAGLLPVIVLGTIFLPLDRQVFDPARVTSLRILDRNGILLREVLSAEEGRGRWSNLSDISGYVMQAAIATEDKRFESHFGVDPIALGRALLQNAREQRVVSGGSTITMQVIRNVYRRPRTLFEKVREMWYALRLERMFSKKDILTQYLNRVSFGNQTVGIDAASRLYFAKPSAQLSLAEAAFLIAIPNSPSLNDPFKRLDRVRTRQRYVLSRMLEEGMISDDEYERATSEPLVIKPRSPLFKAPHFTSMVLQRIPESQRDLVTEIKTTLDYKKQKAFELLLQSHLQRLKRHSVSNGAIVVIDNQDHSVVALVGSGDFFDSTTNGQVNGALALRQPGSTLKPFTYGLALESGMTPASLLADIPRLNSDASIDFLPENYDRRYHGPVRMRIALACSYNVPAVRTLERIGDEQLLRALHAAGFISLRKPASFYGLGLTLGNGEVSLLELTNAYSMLANLGTFHPLRYIDSIKLNDGAGVAPHHWLETEDGLEHRSVPRQVLSPQVAFLLTDILSDRQARAPAFGVHSSLSLPFPAAAKTGTSKDYRDNWTLGYSPRYTVGVWVGNFNARPMKLVSGITGAAPLFRDVMLLLHDDHRSENFPKPEGITKSVICPSSGMRPGVACPGTMYEYFIEGSDPSVICIVHKRVRVDRRTGGIAQRATPVEFVEEKVFEVYPPEFDAWARSVGLPQPPQQIAAMAPRSLPIVINTPASGVIFKMDPVLRQEYQTIFVEGFVDTRIREVTLWLNDEQVAQLRPPFRYRLPLASLHRGSHTMVLRGQRGEERYESPPVTVTVQ